MIFNPFRCMELKLEFNKLKSRVIVDNIWLEYIMEWFHYSVTESCGDGAAIICCNNAEETADFFIKWWKDKYLPKMKQSGYKRDEFYHPQDKYTGPNGELIINYHDSNENFMFSDSVIDLGHGDVTFIINSDCKSYDGFICKKVRS